MKSQRLQGQAYRVAGHERGGTEGEQVYDLAWR